MEQKLLDFYANMRLVRGKLKELQQQHEYCGIVFLDVNRQTLLFTGRKLKELFENPNSRILQSCYAKRIGDFFKSLYGKQETQGVHWPCNFTFIKVTDEKESYWVQLLGWKWKLNRKRNLAGVIWIKLEATDEEPGTNSAGGCRIDDKEVLKQYLENTRDNYMFVWNINEERVVLSKNWTCKFSADDLFKRIDGQMLEAYIVKEDIPKFHKIQKDIMSGQSPGDILMRFYVTDDDRGYAWCKVSFLSILADKSRPLYVVGQVWDVDRKLSRERSGSDSCYTSDRREARQRIDKLLREGEKDKVHGLLAVRASMKEGEMDEEAFWRERAIPYDFVKKLSYIIYPADLLLVNNHSMVVFLGDMGSREAALEKAFRIQKIFDRMMPQSLNLEGGLALWPRNGATYEELLMFAERPGSAREQWIGSDVTEEDLIEFMEEGQNAEPKEGCPHWPASVISDIVDQWYHMLCINSRLRRQMELAESQLMLSQIKPHFLFNTMANIKALIHTDADLAERLIIAFTKCLRTQLDALGKEEMAPIREILDFVGSYIQVEQSRFPGKIQIIYDIQYDKFNMPHFILQPLVENAIKHGLCKKNGVGILRIATYRFCNDICIEIEDDGVGFAQGQERSENSGFGIENVRKRLAYLMDGSLTLHSEIGRGTRAIIRFRGK